MVRKLESLDPYRGRGDGESGRNNSHRVYVNTSQGNDTVTVLETRNAYAYVDYDKLVGRLCCDLIND
jgi:hypothetical protein